MSVVKTFRIENNSEVSADILSATITPDDVGFSFGTGLSLPFDLRPGNALEFDLIATNTGNAGTAIATLSIENTTQESPFLATLLAVFPSEITPIDVPGLLVWLDASQITGKSNGDSMASNDWDNLAPTAMTMIVPGPSPTYQTNIQNGLPCVRFVQSGFQSIVGSPTLLGVSGVRSAFVVCKIPLASFNGNKSIIQFTGLSQPEGKLTGVNGTTLWNDTNWDGVDYVYFKNGTAEAGGQANIPVPSVYQVDSNRPGPGHNFDFVLGNDIDGISWATVDVFEVAVYSVILTPEQRTGLVAGFMDKWGIT